VDAAALHGLVEGARGGADGVVSAVGLRIDGLASRLHRRPGGGTREDLHLGAAGRLPDALER